MNHEQDKFCQSSQTIVDRSTTPLGVLVANLGTPDAPTASALRRYLAEFLWDPRVVDYPRPLWWLILNGIILRIRPGRSAKAYQKVWTENGSPLLHTSRQQAAAIQQQIGTGLSSPVKVVLGMRYGNPSIASALSELRDAGVKRMVVLPLYPQYSCSTTASTFDAIATELKNWREIPEIRMVHNYHNDPAYIDALANSIRETWQQGAPAEKLLFSFHGTPVRFLEEGDPYYCQCKETARLVAARLELDDERWMLVFQSRFGKEAWLQPYMDKTLAELPQTGVRSVDVICPGFSADCLETIEEIDMENREVFLSAGGSEYRYIPCLNERNDHMSALVRTIESQFQGW